MSDYSALDRVLHRMVLGNRAIAEMAFSIDRTLAKPRETAGRHVFVAGLARAGTTILMRRIHASGAFRSLTYADMPFVLAPNLWQRLRGKAGAAEARERAHGDGIAVSTDSPESLDEVFWRVFDGARYIAKDRLLPHAPDADLVAHFRAYVGAVLASGTCERYLSKNNNNVLRLPMLARAFPDAAILIPFRAPLDHAASLLRQHRRFCAVHAKDRFARDYMGWLGHHEFGSDHRPFSTHAPSDHAADTLPYWVDQWIGVYEHVRRTAPANAVFVQYEALCGTPSVWRDLADRIGIAPDIETEALRAPGRGTLSEDVPGATLTAARALYADLSDAAGVAARVAAE